MRTTMSSALLAGIFLAAGLVAAGEPHPAIVAALAHADRPEADRQIDGRRRPDAVLEFFGIRPGMRVLDMFAGGGYYTEILARTVGPDGRILAQNNRAYRDYAAADIAARYASGRLANVERLDVEVEFVDLPAGQLDAALLILAYHDLYFRPGDGSWPEIDGPGMLGEIRKALKPGAVLGIVDHAAAPGGDKVDVATRLHRIEEAAVRREIEAAGFIYEGAIDVLRHPGDDLSQPMYAEGIRGHTDRFVLRFRKPAD